MTMQTIPGGLWIPRPWSGIAAPQVNTESITATTGKVAFMFRIPKAGNVRKLCFNLVTVTTNGLTDARLETVDGTTGFPTGTLVGTTTNKTFTPSAGWNTQTMTLDAAVTLNQEVALVVAGTGATISLTVGDFLNGESDAQYPYAGRFAPSAWSKRSDRPTIALEYDDGSYEEIADCLPVTAAGLTTYNSGSTPDEYALKFQLPFPARVNGWWAYVDGDGDFDVVLYDSDGAAVLSSQSLDKDNRFSANSGLYSGRFAPTTLLVSTNYYLSIKPTSATNIGLARLTFPSTAVMAASEGGANFHEATRTDAGAWTPATTNRPMAGLRFDRFDDGLNGAGELSMAFAG